jgi:aminoglycoside phosphotransferase (APT) family kinase protein
MPADVPSSGDRIGRGYTADVYAWEPGRVLKLFHSGQDVERAEREFRVTRTVHAAGLPVPAVYELVEVGGRRGIVFERVDGPSLLGYVQARPWKLPWSIGLLAALHTLVHQCPAPVSLPAHREWIADRVAIAPLIAGVRDAARRRLATLPDGETVCHGDFHPGNILITRRGPVIIDWGRATRGHPLGDVACTARLIRTAALPPWAPTFMHLTLRATRPILYRKYLAGYQRRAGGTRAEVEAWLGPLSAAAIGISGRPG